MPRKAAPLKPGQTSKLLRVDAEVYTVLARRASGFESPNSVLRRVFGLPPAQRKTRVSP